MGLNKNIRTPGGNVPRSIKKVFKCSTELEKVSGLKIAIWSRAKVGKSHFAFTCPKPVYGIDTEGAWSLNKNQFDLNTQKQVHVSQVLYMAEKDRGKVDLILSLDAAREAMDVLTDYIKYNEKVIAYLESTKSAKQSEITSAVLEGNQDSYWTDLIEYILEEAKYFGSVTCSTDSDPVWTYVKPFPRGTIVLDSGTDIWDWLGIWKDQTFTNDKTKRLDWGHANKKYNEFIMMMLHSKWNVLGTFKAEAAVDPKGGDLGYDKAKWQKKTDYWFDVIIELQKSKDTDDRIAIFRGDRYGGNLGDIINPTWDSVVQFLESKKKIVVEK